MTGNQQPFDSTKKLSERLDVDFALQAAGLGIWEYDPVSKRINWDEQCRGLFGLTKDNPMSYEQAFAFIPPDDAARVNQAAQWVMNPESDGVFDQTYRTLGVDDGKLRWVRFQGRVNFTATGDVQRFAGVAQDVTPQMMAQQTVENSRQQVLNSFELAPFAVAVLIGPTLTYQMTNALYRQLVGRTAEQLMGKPMTEAIPEVNGQGFVELLQQVIRTGIPYEAKQTAFQVQQQNELKTAYFDFTYQPWRQDGEVLGVMIVAAEVTQQVQARQLVEESRTQLHNVIEETPVAMGLHVGADLRIELANDTQLSYWGRDRSVMNKPFREVLPELEGQGFFELFEQAYATGQSYQGLAAPAQLSLNGKFGTYYFDYSFKPIRNEQGQVYAVLNTAINVTEQVVARQALEQQQAQQRFVLQLADLLRPLSDPLAVYYQTACLVGAYLGANRVGYAEDQADGDTIVVLRNYVDGVADLQGTYQYADYGPLLTEFLSGHTVVRPDIAQDPTLTTAQKEAHRQLQLGATLNKPLFRDDRLIAVLFIHYQQAHPWSPHELSLLDMVAERLMIAVDRTRSDVALRQSEARYRHLSEVLEEQVQQRTQELAATNEELAASNEELAANNEEYAAVNEELTESTGLLMRSNDNLEQFAYIASHDLQEPLRKIQSFSTLLKDRYASQLGEGVDYLNRMQVAASRMSMLIRDLLAYSRISTMREVSDLVSLTQVVHSVLTDLELVIEETGATVEVTPLPSLLGDGSQLSQLFQNLLGNALKFRRPDIAPIIQIRSQLVAADHLPSRVKPLRPALIYYCIEVADNGIGFDEKYLDRIFEVFQRLHGKNEITGTGIGLAICEKVVANHGGAITATSKPGQGATFRVYLPV